MVDMSIEQKRAVALAKARQAAQGSGADRGLMGQITSGLTEGAANMLSLPNTVEMGLRSIGPAIGNAAGGNFEMPQESWLPDAGARFRGAADAAGSMTPVTDDPTGKFGRRVAQEIGANIIPAMGTPAKVASVVSSALSGVGAATAQHFLPGNQLAEFAGQVIGGGVPVSIGNQVERMGMAKAAPTLDDLRAAKSAAYSAVDNLGAQYSPKAVEDLILRMQAAGAKINPLRHQKAASVLDDIKGLAGQPQTLTQLDELRQVIKRDLLDTADGGERHWGKEFQSTLDDFIATAHPGFASGDKIARSSNVMTGAPSTTIQSGTLGGIDEVAASTAINKARSLNGRYKRVEDFERQMTKADNATAASGSGGNLNNQIRQKARQILDNPKRTRGYSPEELEALKKVVQPGRGEDALRGIGKIAPGGSGLMTAINLAALSHNPLLAPIPIAGSIAKTIADKGTVNRAAILKALLANGSKTAVPALGPRTAQVVEALMATQAANQNDRLDPVRKALMRVQGLN